VAGPFPVFRAVSPDGLSGVKQLPRMDWAWSDNAGVGKGSDCLPYRQEISAEDFLKYMTPVLQVEFVRDDPNPDLAAFQRNVAANSKALADAGRARNAQASAFQQAQALRQKEHEDFDGRLKEGTQRSMQNTANSMNARSRAADDWCDYSLDQQERLDPNTGLITKDSSAYNYTWINEQGDRVQTNNVNANPNGNGTGNWTLQENIPKL
jgi:hypothetical protein